MKSSSGPALLLFAAFVAALGPAAFASDSPTAKTEPTAMNSSAATAKPDDGSDEPTVTEPAKPDPVAADYWRAIKLLGSKSAADVEAGRIDLKAAADLEYTHAQVLLGNCHLSGAYGFPKSPKKAASLFRLAAERGNAFAKVSLGLCYVTGNGLRQDDEAAVKWLTEAIAADADFSRPSPPPDFFADKAAAEAKDGNEGISGNLGEDPVAQSVATAHHLLGEILMRQKKHSEAQPHFVAAAGNDGRSGIFQAAQQAALNYAFGQGTARDMAKANEMLERARKLTARMGVTTIHNYASLKIVDEFAVADLEEKITEAGAEAQTALQQEIAQQFANRKSKEYNLAEAVKWYELAAENGNAWAMLSLALIYGQGDLGRPDPSKAFQWFEKAGGGVKPKHILGAANLGICYQNGLGTAKDLEKAAAIFKKFRDDDIVCYLGTIGQCPEKIVTYEQALALNEVWATKKNDAHAQYLLGDRFLNGYGVKADFKTAVKWYKKSAKAGDPAGLNELGYLYGKRGLDLGCDTWPEAFKIQADYFAKSVEAGPTPVALYNLAYLAETGRGMRRDPENAKSLYERCLQLDPKYSDAHNNLANLLKAELKPGQSGLSVHFLRNTKNEPAGTKTVRTDLAQNIDPKAVAAIVAHYESANNEGNKFAAYNLGCLYRDGVFCERDTQKAYGFFETAAERGHVGSRLIVGQMLENGEGVPVSYSEAAYHYRLAALDGDTTAASRLVDLYVAGKGVSRDLDRAIFWVSYLAKDGNTRWILRLGDLFIRNQNYDFARKLFLEFTDSAFASVRGTANQRLSILYANGWGVTKDLKKAAKYREKALRDDNLPALHDTAISLFAEGKKVEAVSQLEKAAAKGLPDSQFALGKLYSRGEHVPKDPVRAMQLYKEAALHGYTKAQIALATMTLENQSGAPDLEMAISLAKSAAEKGDPKGAELLEKLESRRKAPPPSEETTKARSS